MYSIYGIEESEASRKNLYYIIWYLCKWKQLNCENYFYHVFITSQGNGHVIKSLTNICLHPFPWKLIYLTRFNSVPIFNRLITLVSANSITCVHSLACVINFNMCFMSNMLCMTYRQIDSGVTTTNIFMFIIISI